MTWKEVAKRTWTRAIEDDVFGRAAQLAYYFLLSLFPLLILIFSIFGLFPSAADHLRAALLRYLGTALPASASALVDKTLNEIIRSSNGKTFFWPYRFSLVGIGGHERRYGHAYCRIRR
jgi:membrane protein